MALQFIKSAVANRISHYEELAEVLHKDTHTRVAPLKVLLCFKRSGVLVSYFRQDCFNVFVVG